MDHLTSTQWAAAAATIALIAGLMATAIAMIARDRPRRPLLALCGHALETRRASGPRSRFIV